MNENFPNNPAWPTEADYLACLQISDANKRRVKAEQEAAKNDPNLCAHLKAESIREGRRGVIDWPAYFRNSGMN